MLKYFFYIFLCFIPTQIFALDTDKQQPVVVQADTTTLNHKTGISTYRGNVKLVQGTTVIIADEIITYTNRKHQLEKAVAVGNPASYKTLPEQDQPEFVVTGQTLNYYPPREWVEAIGDAKANQGKNSFTGPQLNYDMSEQIVSSPPSEKGRTKIIVHPDQLHG